MLLTVTYYYWEQFVFNLMDRSPLCYLPRTKKMNKNMVIEDIVAITKGCWRKGHKSSGATSIKRPAKFVHIMLLMSFTWWCKSDIS